MEDTADTTDATARLTTHKMSVSGGTISVRIGSHFWPRWARIAMHQEGDAVRARLRAAATTAGPDLSAALSDELDAAIQAISAAANAIDTFCRAVRRSVVPPETLKAWRDKRTAQHRQVLETLKLGFVVREPTAERWLHDLKWLFDLRGEAVHFAEPDAGALKDSQLHPLGYGMAPEHVAYSLESTERAIDLMLEVLELCTTRPKQANSDLGAYVIGMSEEVRRLVQMREGNAA